MSQTEAVDVKPSLAEITRETPAIDLNFEETTVQRIGDGVLLQFYRQDDLRMYEVTFKPTPGFCADIDRLFEVMKIAASQQDPDIRFKMEEKTDSVQLHLLVTLRSALGVDHRSLTAQVSVVNEQRSMWHRISKEVRGLREKNAALESRLELVESTQVVFAVGHALQHAKADPTDPRLHQHRHFSTQLVCDTLYVPIEPSITYFASVMDNVRAKTVHLVQHSACIIFGGHALSFSVEEHGLFRNKHASQLTLEVTAECVTNGYDRSGPTACWAWVQKVLGNFPKCEVVIFIVAGSHPPDSVIRRNAHLRFVFRAVGKEGCPESWRALAESSKNVSIEYTS